MDKHIQTIEALISENLAVKEERTAYLDISLGALRTAREYALAHAAEPHAKAIAALKAKDTKDTAAK